MQELIKEFAPKIKDSENIDIEIEKAIKELNKIEDRDIKEESIMEQTKETLDIIEKNENNMGADANCTSSHSILSQNQKRKANCSAHRYPSS